MTTSVPNVNFFIGYVDCLKGKSSKDDYVKQNFEARRFYSSSKDYDYVKYVNTGSKEKLDFVAYSGNHEKSHGIFDKRGILTPEQIKELRAKLRKTNSPIWHGVISFTEEFGNQFCDSYEKAYSMMTAEFPKFFKKAGLNPGDNIGNSKNTISTSYRKAKDGKKTSSIPPTEEQVKRLKELGISLESKRKSSKELAEATISAIKDPELLDKEQQALDAIVSQTKEKGGKNGKEQS